MNIIDNMKNMNLYEAYEYEDLIKLYKMNNSQRIKCSTDNCAGNVQATC